MPAATATVTATTAPAPATALIPPINGWTTVWGYAVNPNALLLFAAVAIIAFFIIKAQRSRDPNSFDFADLVMDDITPTAGKPDRTRKASVVKMLFLLSFAFSTWVVYDQEMKLSPVLTTVFGIWMTVWPVAMIAKLIFDKKDAPTFTIAGEK